MNMVSIFFDQKLIVIAIIYQVVQTTVNINFSVLLAARPTILNFMEV